MELSKDEITLITDEWLPSNSKGGEETEQQAARLTTRGHEEPGIQMDSEGKNNENEGKDEL